MAKKKKRNSKNNKVQRNHKSEDLVVNNVATGIVTVPDWVYRARRKQQSSNGVFVNGNKRKALASQVPFVSESCITNSTTPVIHFSKQDPTSLPEKSLCSKKRKPQYNKGIAFIPKDCLTDSVSLPYMGQVVSKPHKAYVLPIDLPKAHDIVLEQKYRRHRMPARGSCVPVSCITSSTTPIFRYSVSIEPEPLVNPYPDLPGLAPAITGSTKRARNKAKGSEAFVTASCITDSLAKVSIVPTQDVQVPVVKYEYIERPNSPDIYGPQIKRNRKQKNNVVAFVPKSCTVEKRTPVVGVEKGEALARNAPATLPQKVPGVNRLPLFMFIFILMVFIYYLLTN